MNEVSIPYLYSATLVFMGGLIACLLLYFKKYILVIVVCVMTLLMNQVGHQYALFWTGLTL
jgi:hypothetical protein